MLGRRLKSSLVPACLGVALFSLSGHVAAQGVTVEQILKYRPVQPGVEVETPDPDEIAQCKVEVERSGKASGWVVYGPGGQVLRRFVDTDGDNVVDQWRYYRHGFEIYRDIDTNANNEVDQSRWLNLGGTRWGIDSNEDGKIDRWIRLSAEEASREAIRAMTTRDAGALAAILINDADIKSLGLSKDVASDLRKAIANPAQKLQSTLAKTRSITSQSRWIRFDCSMLTPNLIPKESGKAKQDLHVYENVMAIIETNNKTGFVQIGEMVQVGDVWKLTSIPQPLEGESMEVAAGGILMQPSLAALTTGTVDFSPEMQKLIEELQKLDESAPGINASNEQAQRYNIARARLLGRLAAASSSKEEKTLWLRQQIDTIGAAAQMGAYPRGIDELNQIEQTIRKEDPNSPLVPYALFHKLLAKYNADLQQAEETENRSNIQEQWTKTLEQFVTQYPKADNTSDALLQLAVSYEFLGMPDKALPWYEKLAANYQGTPSAARGAGALHRLKLIGQPLQLSGTALGGGTLDTNNYRGKVLAVIFWATNCKPCTEELPQMIELYRKYHAQGFEIIGVNLDTEPNSAKQYIQQFRVPWQHIAEPGGFESPPAQKFGIITLPTMFLVDRQGKVVSSSASLEELKEQVPKLLGK